MGARAADLAADLEVLRNTFVDAAREVFAARRQSDRNGNVLVPAGEFAEARQAYEEWAAASESYLAELARSGPSSMAAAIARRFDDDGYVWIDENNVPLSDVVTAAAQTEHRFGNHQAVYEFPDGSAIGLTPTCWDVVRRVGEGAEAKWVSVNLDGSPSEGGLSIGGDEPVFTEPVFVHPPCGKH